MPGIHHVVFVVGPDRLDAATEFLEALGFRFQTHKLADVGLRVILDWDRGVELVTPTSDAPTNPGSVADFLTSRGEGVYSVVLRVEDADASMDVARRYGASAQYRQDRSANGLELIEVQLATIFGMPLTLLSTNLSCFRQKH